MPIDVCLQETQLQFTSRSRVLFYSRSPHTCMHGSALRTLFIISRNVEAGGLRSKRTGNTVMTMKIGESSHRASGRVFARVKFVMMRTTMTMLMVMMRMLRMALLGLIVARALAWRL